MNKRKTDTMKNDCSNRCKPRCEKIREMLLLELPLEEEVIMRLMIRDQGETDQGNGGATAPFSGKWAYKWII